MHRQNFDTESVSNYPLTINRMGELQDDLQVPLRALAGMHPLGDCIVAGCENGGARGYAIVGSPDGNGGTSYEVYEVRPGNASARWLVLTEQTSQAENSDGETVAVRQERYLDWALNRPASGVYVYYAELPRLRLNKTAQDDAGWTNCAAGLNWHAGVAGSPLKVQRTAGRIHLTGYVKYGIFRNGVPTYTGTLREELQAAGETLAEADEVPVVPAGYRPSGDMLIAVRYNGAAAMAVIDCDGRILIGQESELGDTLKIDTWYEIGNSVIQ